MVSEYRVIGRIRLGPGDTIWLDNPEQIKTLQAMGLIEDKPIKPEKKQQEA